MARTRVYTYNVVLREKWAPDKDDNPRAVRAITLEVPAEDICDAMNKAWETLRVTPQDYEIVCAECNNYAHRF